VTFPVDSSVLSAAALAERILPAYDLPGTPRCQLVNRGDNDTYLVTAAGRRYALRAWNQERTDRAEVEAELELLEALACRDIPVARPIRRRDGGRLQAVDAPEGPRFVALFAFAEGRPPGRGITAEQGRAYGRAVARMHAAMDELPLRLARPRNDLARLLDEPVAALLPELAHRAADQAFLIDLRERLTAGARGLPETAPWYGLCHCDLHKENVLFAPGGGLTILDFDCCGYGWRAYELAVLSWSTRWLPQAAAVRAAFLRGYEEIRPLEPAERAALPHFVAIQDVVIMHVELGTARRGIQGARAVDDAFFDRHLRFLRAWMDGITPA
jgi:Ser/Thr protein kinase RdoA (MazF antagonist)